MTFDASIDARIESCLDAARACGEALAFVRANERLAADDALTSALNEAARVAKLSADCLERTPDLRDMVLSVCVEIMERAALGCARHADVAEMEACGETLAACAALCAGEGVAGLQVATFAPAPVLVAPMH